MRRLIAPACSLAILVFVVFGPPAAPSHACTCTRPAPTAEQDFERAVAVFTGQVVEIDRGAYPFNRPVRVRFAISGVEKGVSGRDALELWTAPHSAACGYTFHLRSTYRVYAYTDRDGRLATGTCSGTRVLVEVPPTADEVAALERENAPRPWPQESGLTGKLAAGAMVLALVALVGGWLWSLKSPD